MIFTSQDIENLNSSRANFLNKLTTLPLENRLQTFTEEIKTYTSSGNIQVDYVAARPQTKKQDYGPSFSKNPVFDL